MKFVDSLRLRAPPPPHEMCGASQALRILSMKLPRRLRLCRLAEICGTSEALRAPLVDCVKRLGC